MSLQTFFFRAERLAVGYGGKAVVEGVEVSLERGRILTLIGPNGSGKSTILKSIAKQLKLVGGVVWIGGKSVENVRAADFSRQTAVVLTERPRPERMTCGDVAAVGRYPYTGRLGLLSPHDREKIDQALLMVGALDLRDRPFGDLSDGQLQRVMLARAICQEPEVIVLDEPTSFLDVRYALEILDILAGMAKGGVTVILSLHELYYARRVSDLVLCVKDGKIFRLDTPERVFTEPVISELYDLPEGAYAQLFGC